METLHRRIHARRIDDPQRSDPILSAKHYIRTLLSQTDVEGKHVRLSLSELSNISNKNPATIRTMLSDLKNPRYAGREGTFPVVSVRGVDGVTRYCVNDKIV